jgi:hypothetical protein
MVYGVTLTSMTRKGLAQLLTEKSTTSSIDTESKRHESLFNTFYSICSLLGIKSQIESDIKTNTDERSLKNFNIILCHMTLTDCMRIRAEYLCFGDDVSVSILDTTSSCRHRNDNSLNNKSYLGSYKRNVTDLLKGHRLKNNANQAESVQSQVLSSSTSSNRNTRNNGTPSSKTGLDSLSNSVSQSSSFRILPSFSSEKRVVDDSLRQIEAMTGRVDLMERNTILFLGVKVNEDSKKRLEEDPFRIFFKQSESLDKKLRVFSENVKSMQGDGHFVMALQPNFDDHLPHHHDHDAAGLDFPEKYKSWDYILQENHVKEKSSPSEETVIKKTSVASLPLKSPSSSSCLEEKIIPVVKKNSVMMSEYTLSALRVQRDYIESQHNNSGTAYLQLFRI